MPVDPTRLLAQSEVCLFGWLIGSSQGKPPPTPPKDPDPIFEADSLVRKGDRQSGVGPLNDVFPKGAWLASIHAFSCEGRYSQFRTPALFLVSSVGDPVWEDVNRQKLRPERFGLPHLDKHTEFASDLRFWTYDRGAHTVRLDMAAGTVQRLVIDVEAGGPPGRRIDLVGQESTFMGRLSPGTP